MASSQSRRPLRIGWSLRLIVAVLIAQMFVQLPNQAGAVVSGDLVTPEEQHAMGLVSIGTNCSGALLVNDWVLTAGHCVADDRHQPANVTFTLRGIAPAPDATATADAIYLFGGYADEVGPDLALVHLSTPFVINGSPTGFVNQLWPGTPESLIGTTVTTYGQGRNPCNTPGSEGTYRVAQLPLDVIDRAATERPIDLSNPPTTFVTQTGGNYYRLASNANGQILAPGDSGGPGFIWSDGIPYIVGIQSGGNCTTSAHQVSIPTVREWIAAVLKTQWTPGATSQPVWVVPAELDATGWPVDDVNAIGWAQATRAATAACYARGFAAGHFDGHQGSLNGHEGFGLQCSEGDTLWIVVTAADIAATGWGFTDVNAVPWAQANRAAERICAGLNQGYAGGHFNGHMRDGGYGMFCYWQGAEWFDALDAELAATGWGFATDNIDDVPWAQAARAAVGFCRAKGFSGGFLNGHHVPGLWGVVCQS